ncbi:hypothetical protein FQN52_003915 [Onygenales sp. PD_12]|nr:hypothetical protein FQN52_003915 [Onygenales sp. PD_12]
MDFEDASYSRMVPDILTILEVDVAIIVSISTILPPIFDRIFYSIASMTSKNIATRIKANAKVQAEAKGSPENPRRISLPHTLSMGRKSIERDNIYHYTTVGAALEYPRILSHERIKVSGRIMGSSAKEPEWAQADLQEF